MLISGEPRQSAYDVWEHGAAREESQAPDAAVLTAPQSNKFVRVFSATGEPIHCCSPRLIIHFFRSPFLHLPVRGVARAVDDY